MEWIYRFLRRNLRVSGDIISIAYALITIIIGLLSWKWLTIASDHDNIQLIVGLVFSFCIGQIIIFAIVMKWFTEHHLKEPIPAAPYVEHYSDTLAFVRRRNQILTTIETSGDADETIYITSNYDFFGLPSHNSIPPINSEAKKRNMAIINENKNFVRIIAQKTMNQKKSFKCRILMNFDTISSNPNIVRDEIISIMQAFYIEGWKKDIEWDHYNFEIIKLNEFPRITYIAIGEHIFMTIRHLPNTNRISYMYMRDRYVSKVYHDWIKDIFEYGSSTTPPIAAGIPQSYFDAIKQEARKYAEKAALKA